MVEHQLPKLNTRVRFPSSAHFQPVFLAESTGFFAFLGRYMSNFCTRRPFLISPNCENATYAKVIAQKLLTVICQQLVGVAQLVIFSTQLGDLCHKVLRQPLSNASLTSSGLASIASLCATRRTTRSFASWSNFLGMFEEFPAYANGTKPRALQFNASGMHLHLRHFSPHLQPIH